MSDGLDGSSSGAIKVCANSIRTGQKCASCKSNVLHAKCLEPMVKIGKIVDIKTWECKECVVSLFDLSDLSDEKVTIIETIQWRS